MPAPPDERLVALLRGNRVLWDCLDRLSALELPNWYLGAGCVAQTVWNAAHGKALGSDIADYDFVYFDAADLTQEGENAVATRARSAVGDLPIHLDVKNQARVHRWYPRHFGYAIEPYTSAEDAIRTWHPDHAADLPAQGDPLDPPLAAAHHPAVVSRDRDPRRARTTLPTPRNVTLNDLGN